LPNGIRSAYTSGAIALVISLAYAGKFLLMAYTLFFILPQGLPCGFLLRSS